MNLVLSSLLRSQYPCLAVKKSFRSFHYSANNLGVIRPFLLADIGEGITECEVIKWFVKPGETVAEFDKICEVQSDKASVEISSRYAGNIVKIHYGPNDIAKVGSALVDIETEDDDSTIDLGPSASTDLVGVTTQPSNYMATWETPAVRRLLNEYGLKVNTVTGSGKNGRVLKGDVLCLIKDSCLTKKAKEHNFPKINALLEPIVDNTIGDVSDKNVVPLNAIQKAMFNTMTKSLAIPQLGYKDEIELTATSEYKNALNSYIASKPDNYPFKKISYLPILIKGLSLSLSLYPIMNAQVIENSGTPQINYRNAHNIGVAMDTPNGLIVPNIKNVQEKTIFQVAGELHRLTQLAKKNSIPLSDLKGGTITLSNIGSIGGTYANPIIVSNESAIVALGSARRLPRMNELNKIVAKQMMPVSWSADHRVIDGATIAQFGNTWKSFVENPALLASRLH